MFLFCQEKEFSVVRTDLERMLQHIESELGTAREEVTKLRHQVEGRKEDRMREKAQTQALMKVSWLRVAP